MQFLRANVLTCGPRAFWMMARMSSGLTSRIPFSSLASALRRAGRRCWFRAMTWPSFCRPGTFAISRSRRTSADVLGGKLDLLQELRSEPRGREVRHHKHHRVAHRRTPLLVGLRNQGIHRNDLIHDPSRHRIANGLAGRASESRLNSADSFGRGSALRQETLERSAQLVGSELGESPLRWRTHPAWR